MDVFSVLSVVMSMLSVQVGAAFAKELFPLIGPLPTVMLRISIAAILLVLIWRPWRFSLNKRSVRAIFLYGSCLGLMNLSFYLSLTRIPLGICVALEFMGPLTVALLSSQRKLDVLWVFLAALGIILILPLKTGHAALSITGILLALLAGFFWALYIVFGKKVGALVHGGVATSLGMVVAALVTLPFSLSRSHIKDFSPRILWIGFGVAILSSAIPYTIEMFAMKKIPTKTFGILMSLEPALAALSGLFILGEHLEASQWLAIVSVMIASAGSANTASPNRPKAFIPETLPTSVAPHN